MRGILAGLLLGAAGCAAPPFGNEDRVFLGHAPDSLTARRVQQWKALQERDDAGLISWAARVRFPSRESWSRISSRRTGTLKSNEK